MSKVGKLPVAIPAGVTVNVANGLISVKGPKGELKQSFHDEIDIKVEGTEVVLTTKNNAKQTNAYHGLYRSLINNMVKGVTEGFTKTLVITGVGVDDVILLGGGETVPDIIRKCLPDLGLFRGVNDGIRLIHQPDGHILQLFGADEYR